MTLAHALFWMWSGVVAPEPEGAVVLPARVRGLPDDADARAREVVVAGMRRSELAVDGVDSPAGYASGCDEPACIREVLAQENRAWAISVSIVGEDNVYTLHLAAHGPDGEVVAEVDERCEICGTAEVEQTLADLSARMAQTLMAQNRRRPLLAVRTAPEGARVWLDGEFIGRTPVERQVQPGAHELRIVKDGYVEQTRSFDAVAATTADIEVVLGARTDHAALRDRRTRRLTIAGATSVSVGALGLAGGIALLVLDERPYRRDCDADPFGTCRLRYDTLAGGAALTAVGSALVVTGVALLVTSRRHQRKGGRG